MDADPRLATLNDVAIAASFLMLLAVVVFGLLSWITAGLPASVVTCSQTENGVALEVWIEVPSILEPTVSP